MGKNENSERTFRAERNIFRTGDFGASTVVDLGDLLSASDLANGIKKDFTKAGQKVLGGVVAGAAVFGIAGCKPEAQSPTSSPQIEVTINPSDTPKPIETLSPTDTVTPTKENPATATAAPEFMGAGGEVILTEEQRVEVDRQKTVWKDYLDVLVQKGILSGHEASGQNPGYSWTIWKYADGTPVVSLEVADINSAYNGARIAARSGSLKRYEVGAWDPARTDQQYMLMTAEGAAKAIGVEDQGGVVFLDVNTGVWSYRDGSGKVAGYVDLTTGSWTKGIPAPLVVSTTIFTETNGIPGATITVTLPQTETAVVSPTVEVSQTATVTATESVSKTEFTQAEIEAAMVPDAEGKLHISTEMFRYLTEKTMDPHFWDNMAQVPKENAPVLTADALKEHGIPDDVIQKILEQKGPMEVTYLSDDFQWKEGMTVDDVNSWSLHNIEVDAYGNGLLIEKFNQLGFINNNYYKENTGLYPIILNCRYRGQQELGFGQTLVICVAPNSSGKDEYIPVLMATDPDSGVPVMDFFLVDKNPLKIYPVDGIKNDKMLFDNVLKNGRLLTFSISRSRVALLGSDFTGLTISADSVFLVQTTSTSDLMKNTVEFSQ